MSLSYSNIIDIPFTRSCFMHQFMCVIILTGTILSLQYTSKITFKIYVFQFMVHAALVHHHIFTLMVAQLHGQTLVASCTMSHITLDLKHTTFALGISLGISLLQNIAIKTT